MKTHTTIPRKEAGQDVYARLQESALKQVQRYAGELWSDYNEHDPGVTIMDALNYCLLEMDYRLRFPLPDYLAGSDQPWTPAANLLFAPERIFPVRPVTETDYRKMFVASIDELRNAWATADRQRGMYHFVLDAGSGIGPEQHDDILRKAEALYHANRGLCERPGSISLVTYKPVVPHADIELDEQAEPNRLMARICFEIDEFLNGGIRFRPINELQAEGKTPGEMLDGPLQRRMAIDDGSIREWQNEFDLLALRGRLANLSGVARVNALAFETDGQMTTDYLCSGSEWWLYTIYPSQIDGITLRKHGKETTASAERVHRTWKSIYVRHYGLKEPDDDLAALQNNPPANYRNIYSHRRILNDLPAFYRKNDDLQSYLNVFDRFIGGVLSELRELPVWMSAGSSRLPHRYEAWLDTLDRLYGVESNPEYLKKRESRMDNRRRRTAFLSDVPRWGYERGHGRDLTDCSAGSLSGIERYMNSLFNLAKYDLRLTLIEHVLLAANEQADADIFSISAVISANDNYLHCNEFRDCCEQILLSRTPAHIRVRVRWTDRQGLKRLEADYNLWKYLLATPGNVDPGELGDKIKRRLEDDHNWYGEI